MSQALRRPRVLRRLVKFALICLPLFCAAFIHGYLAHRDHVFPYSTLLAVRERLKPEPAETPQGSWHKVRQADDDESLTEMQQAERRKLLALGYVSGSVLAPKSSGVTVCDRELANPGFRLFASGHAAEALLIDLDGNVRHCWRYDYDRIWPEARAYLDVYKGNASVDFWRRVHLLPSGDLLAIYEGNGLIRINKDSELIWAYPGRCHHDLCVTPDGGIIVLTRDPRIIPRIHPERPVLEEFLTFLTPDGEVERHISLLELFENSPYTSLLKRGSGAGDIFHTNTVELLDGRLSDGCPAFKEGNILISVRELDAVCVVDPSVGQVVWSLSGMWHRQHEPNLLDNGHILLFDNRGHNGRSKVVEFDPITQTVEWCYEDDPVHPLYSKNCGSSHRLPNGNTLITESNAGRAIEVTRDKNIVWEYLNPYRTGEDDELIAGVFDMVLVPHEAVSTWLAPTNVAAD